MDTSTVAQLRRLESDAARGALPFDYDGLMERHAARRARAQRRHRGARATAGVLVVALIGASLWRLAPPRIEVEHAAESANAIPDSNAEAAAVTPRIVRADTYLALAALEDHIARVDDAISVARVYAPQGTEVARLERARNELLDSYAQVRYAELVSANF